MHTCILGTEGKLLVYKFFQSAHVQYNYFLTQLPRVMHLRDITYNALARCY